jgi:hypothetical protein
VGLDVVEFVMAVEDAFGIKIPDQEAERLTTPGKLKQFVLASVASQGTSATCLSQRAFYRLRAVLPAYSDVPRRQIGPTSSWEDLLPWRQRRQAWVGIGVGAGLPLPRLVRPTWLVIAGFSISVVVAIGALLLWQGDLRVAVAFAVAASLVVAFVMEAATRPWCRRFSPAHETVGAVAEYSASIAPARLKAPGEAWTPGEVSRVVDGLIRSHFAVEDFNDDSDFVRDIGID